MLRSHHEPGLYNGTGGDEQVEQSFVLGRELPYLPTGLSKQPPSYHVEHSPFSVVHLGR